MIIARVGRPTTGHISVVRPWESSMRCMVLQQQPCEVMITLYVSAAVCIYTQGKIWQLSLTCEALFFFYYLQNETLASFEEYEL